MATPQEPAVQQGMSTRKKWIIGCSGCLGVLLLLSVALALVSGLVWDNVKKVSSSSVSTIFGDKYSPEHYTAFGMPFPQGRIRNIAMLIDKQSGTILFAFDGKATQKEITQVQKQDIAALKQYFNTAIQAALTKTARQNSSMKIQDIRLENGHYIQLSRSKSYPLFFATIETERKGETSFLPAACAILPQSGARMVTLLATDPRENAPSIEPGFKETQEYLEGSLKQVIQESELDDRLPSGANAGQPADSKSSECASTAHPCSVTD